MGYTKEVLQEGSGDTPNPGSKVTVHCTGYGKNGDMSLKFWSTKDEGQKPFVFNVGMGEVIKAWDAGVISMKLGEIARISADADFAYGAGGFPAWGIMPNSPLIFEIEVLKIN